MQHDPPHDKARNTSSRSPRLRLARQAELARCESQLFLCLLRPSAPLKLLLLPSSEALCLCTLDLTGKLSCTSAMGRGLTKLGQLHPGSEKPPLALHDLCRSHS